MPRQLELELAGDDLRGRDELHKTVDAGELVAGDCAHVRIRHETKTHAFCVACKVEMHPGAGVKHYGGWVPRRPGQRRNVLPQNGQGRRGD